MLQATTYELCSRAERMRPVGYEVEERREERLLDAAVRIVVHAVLVQHLAMRSQLALSAVLAL